MPDDRHRAWPNAEIIGVDLHSQPRYPFAMFRGDVRLAMDVFDPASFDFIHASPPCQAHATAVGEVDVLADECAAARAEIRGRFASAIERARNWTLPKAVGR